MASTNPEPLVYRTEKWLPAPPAKVWELLTTSHYTRQYLFNCGVESDFRVGSRIEFEDDQRVQVTGTIREIAPPHLLVHTVFDPEMGIPDLPENYLDVRYQLTEQDGGTLLQVSQGDYATVANGEERWSHAEMGWSHVLNALEQILQAEQ